MQESPPARHSLACISMSLLLIHELQGIHYLPITVMEHPNAPQSFLQEESDPQVLKHGVEVQPLIGKLEVRIIEAKDIIPCCDPYILCIYDHSEHCADHATIAIARTEIERLKGLTIDDDFSPPPPQIPPSKLDHPKWDVYLTL
jgi:hypothetical protein